MTTVADLLTEIRDALNEPTAAAWQDDTLIRWINEANRDLARATRHIKGSVTVADVGDGESEYAVDASVVAIEHAYFVPDDDTARKIPLIAKHYEGMDQVWGQWQNTGGSWPQFFTTMGYSPNLIIKVFPPPTVDGALELIVSKLPAAIALPADPTGDADVPALWYDALVDYVEAKALRRDRDPRWQEARQLYVEKRDNLINNPDYLAVNREMLPVPGVGYGDAWLHEFEE